MKSRKLQGATAAVVAFVVLIVVVMAGLGTWTTILLGSALIVMFWLGFYAYIEAKLEEERRKGA